MPARKAGTATPTCEIAGEQQAREPAVPDRHQRAERHRDDQRDDHARQDQPERHLQPVGHLRSDRRPGDVGLPRVAAQQAADPPGVLRHGRAVEPEVLPERGHRLVGGVDAQGDPRRVPGQQRP